MLFRKKEVKEYYENGLLMSEGYYKNDVRVGKHFNYDEKGNITDEWIFSKTGERLSFKRYHQNGNLAEDGNYKDDTRSGIWNYYDENGELHSSEEYKYEDILGGYDLDQVIRITNYYSDGSIKSKGDELAMGYHGEWIYYFSNGQIESQGEYLDGDKHLEWTYYNKDGSLKEILEYERGAIQKTGENGPNES